MHQESIYALHQPLLFPFSQSFRVIPIYLNPYTSSLKVIVWKYSGTGCTCYFEPEIEQTVPHCYCLGNISLSLQKK